MELNKNSWNKIANKYNKGKFGKIFPIVSEFCNLLPPNSSILDLGSAAGFHFLDNWDQMRLVDIHLFLADQLRFEMMLRLDWLLSYGGSKYSLLEMVKEFDTIKINCRQNPPDLARSNPNYSEYTELTDGDKEVFIRRLLQEALDEFKERI